MGAAAFHHVEERRTSRVGADALQRDALTLPRRAKGRLRRDLADVRKQATRRIEMPAAAAVKMKRQVVKLPLLQGLDSRRARPIGSRLTAVVVQEAESRQDVEDEAKGGRVKRLGIPPQDGRRDGEVRERDPRSDQRVFEQPLV